MPKTSTAEPTMADPSISGVRFGLTRYATVESSISGAERDTGRARASGADRTATALAPRAGKAAAT
jgi:hypothetical protein